MRSDPAFFDDADTAVAIDRIAHESHLAIYAGSGVTITRTGLDWAEMIRQLVPAQITPVLDRAKLTELFGNNAAASVVVEMFKQVYGQSETGVQLRNELRRLLYRRSAAFAGPLTDNLALLLNVRDSVRQGTLVLTTNFDNHLDRSLDLMRGMVGANAPTPEPMHVRHWTRSALTGQREGFNRLSIDNAGGVDLVHLHGYLVDSEQEPCKFENEVQLRELDPVIAEDDYARSAGMTERLLTETFARRPTLLLGTSVEDPPLIRALVSQTIDDDATPGRWVLMPLQSKPALATGDQDIVEFERYQSLRLRHLKLTPIFPDFFGQVSQFIQELALASHLDVGAYSATGSDYQYSARLGQWWRQWQNLHLSTLDDARIAHADHQRRLTDSLSEIRTEILRANNQELLKLELWVRWDPKRYNRRLRLWASSVGTVSSQALMREGEIETPSPYVSIQAFCYGGPQAVADNKVKESRWRTYLTLPIRITPSRLPYDLKEGLTEVPVAVISLASTLTESQGSSLGHWNQGAHDLAFRVMLREAHAILQA